MNEDRVGEKNPRAVLSDQQAREIRQLRANGWSHRDLMLFFGASAATVHDIIKGKSYKGAGGPVEPPGRGAYYPSVIAGRSQAS